MGFQLHTVPWKFVPELKESGIPSTLLGLRHYDFWPTQRVIFQMDVRSGTYRQGSPAASIRGYNRVFPVHYSGIFILMSFGIKI